LTDLTLVAWALVEVGVRVREGIQGKGRPDRDRATRLLIGMTLGAAIVAALGARSVAPTLRMPEPLRMAGVVVMWLGLALRVWAIAALGGAFRTTIEVEPGQTVVSTGPYRWIRHPSYAGLLLIVAGLGAALGNWLSLTACVVLPLSAIVWRMHRGSRAQPRSGRGIPHVPIRQSAFDPTALVSTNTDFGCERDAPSPAWHRSSADRVERGEPWPRTRRRGTELVVDPHARV
jgi:protein-S-isoprenylcysteine O-methyltransferase Ste14